MDKSNSKKSKAVKPENKSVNCFQMWRRRSFQELNCPKKSVYLALYAGSVAFPKEDWLIDSGIGPYVSEKRLDFNFKLIVLVSF
uniref:Uncharacterized protein n=1 Tax=Megaselia scalaris TaxID=36166 RepID=T1GM47_MEGSC